LNDDVLRTRRLRCSRLFTVAINDANTVFSTRRDARDTSRCFFYARAYYKEKKEESRGKKFITAKRPRATQEEATELTG